MTPTLDRPTPQPNPALELELGRGRKEPLRLRSPLFAASGAAGSGALLQALCPRHELGALVLPVLDHRTRDEGRARTVQPVTGGCLMASTPAVGRRRLAAIVRRCRAHSDVPLVAALAPATIYECESLCETVLDLGVRSIELHVAQGVSTDDLAEIITLLTSAPLQACLVRLPLVAALPLAEAAASAGADALVVAAPLDGRILAASEIMLSGVVHAPSLSPIYAQAVHEVSEIGLPVVGRGGIASWTDVLTMLASGAVAAELDSILWSEPAALDTIYKGMVEAVRAAGVTRWEEYLGQLTV